MAGGELMTLAYLGEMGLILNIGYVALDRGRYVEKARNRILSFKLKIKDPPTPKSDKSKQELARLLLQFEDLFHPDRTRRQAAWHVKRGGNLKHFNKTCGAIYDFFYEGRDKTLAELAGLLAGITLVAMTLLDHTDCCDQLVESAKLWWVIFGLAILSNLIPTALVVAGRRLKQTADIVGNEKVRAFGLIATVSIDQEIDAGQSSAQ